MPIRSRSSKPQDRPLGSRLLRGLALLLLLWPVSPVRAGEIPIRSFTAADHLPGLDVRAIVQDSGGRLWVGTEKGLASYFGSEFHLDQEPQALQSAPVWALAATPAGELYVGTAGSLDYRDPAGNWQSGIELGTGVEPSKIESLTLAQDGWLWVGGEVLLARCKGGKCEPLQIAGVTPPISAIAEDSLGRMWIAAPTAGVVHIVQNGVVVDSLGPKDHLPEGATIRSLFPPCADPADPPCVESAGPPSSDPGEMWAASDLGLLHIQDLKVTETFTAKDGLGNDEIKAILPVQDGNGLWIGSNGGLQLFENDKIQQTYTVRDQLAGNTVESLAYDAEGDLWVGTGYGISRLPLSAFPRLSDPLLDFQDVKAVLPISLAGGFAITDAGVVEIEADGNCTLINNPHNLVFSSLAKDINDTLWAGSNLGLVSHDQKQGFVLDPRLPGSVMVSTLLFDRNQGLWVGTDSGLYYLDGEKVNHFDQASKALGQDPVLSLWETDSGDIWAGTLNGGASRYRGGKWTPVSRASTNGGLADDTIEAGLEDSNGNLWFGTQNGLSRLRAGADPAARGSWTSFFSTYAEGSKVPGSASSKGSLSPGLAGDRINGLVEDSGHPGVIWAATSAGLSVIKGDQVRNYTLSDGLAHPWVNAIGQAEGQFWIGTPYGLAFHRDRGIPPLLELADIRIGRATYSPAGAVEPLSYRTEQATFEFGSSDLADLEQVTYRLSIARKAAFWTGEPQVVYTDQNMYTLDLQPGSSYVVSVQAVDRGFNESNVQTFTTLKVNQINFLDWMAGHSYLYVPIAALLAFGFYLLIRFIRRRRFYTSVLRLQVQSEAGSIVCREAKSRRELSRKPLPREYDLAVRLDERLRQTVGKDPRLLEDLGNAVGEILFDPAALPVLQKLGLGKGNHWTDLYLDLGGCPQQLRALPWEFMAGDKQLGHLALKSRMAVVHELGKEETPCPEMASIRILAILANPASPRLSQLTGLEEEMEAIHSAVAASGRKRQVEVVTLSRAKWEEAETLIRQGFEIVHFSGHGGVFDGDGVLFFEDSHGSSVPVGLEQLVDGFQQSRRTRLVVLNACRSAESTQPGRAVGLAEALVAAGAVPAAVGMGYPFFENSAALFSSSFYTHLLSKGQVDFAMLNARLSLANAMRDRRDWGTPRLYSCLAAGALFEWS